MGTFEYFEHTADVGMRVAADSLAELLATAGRGLTNLFVQKPAAIAVKEQKSFELAGEDPAILLFDLLNEMLYLFATEGLLFADIRIAMPGHDHLYAELAGERLDPARHEPGYEVKAVTYHGLCVKESGGRWQAEVIFDI